MSARFNRRRLLALALGVASVAAVGCGEACSCEGPRPEAPAVTVYIVRHAEKLQPVEGASPEHIEDPPLSPAGELRAMGLAEDIPVRELDAIFVTRTVRSEATASAVIALTGIKPTYYPAKDYPGIVSRLRKRPGQSVLIVGHSNTIPPMLAALGVGEAPTIDESQYGDLWVVTMAGDGSATLETRRFGESIDRFDPGR